MDFREIANRKEAFIRWYAWSLEYKDCDPAVWLTNYLHRRYEHNREQRYWLAWLYGNTYQLPTAWVLLQEFPDFELATYDRIKQWNDENYLRLRYQVDTKWNKGHLPEMFKSYKEWIGDGTQEDKFRSLFRDNPSEYFDVLWTEIKQHLFKFGRYSTWFYLQHLRHTADVDVFPTSLMFNDYAGSRSHRNGFLFALGMEDRVDEKLREGEYDYLEGEGNMIMAEMQSRFPHLASAVDAFTMETCLCSFKKIFREHHGRYLGYYLDRQAEEIQKAETDGWHGIEWNVLWQARKEMLDGRLEIRTGVDKSKYSTFVESGNMLRLDWMFTDVNPVANGIEQWLS